MAREEKKITTYIRVYMSSLNSFVSLLLHDYESNCSKNRDETLKGKQRKKIIKIMFEDDLNLFAQFVLFIASQFLLYSSLIFCEAPIDEQTAFLQMTAKANKLKNASFESFSVENKIIIFLRHWHHFFSLCSFVFKKKNF